MAVIIILVYIIARVLLFSRAAQHAMHPGKNGSFIGSCVQKASAVEY